MQNYIRSRFLVFELLSFLSFLSHLPSNRASQGQTEHMHELRGPLATCFRKGISPGNALFSTNFNFV
jgi:hypothetical protein